MPVLSCAATTCVYNKEELCSKGDIQVGGEDAQHSSDTCCSSFKERAEDSMSNSTGAGCGTIDVECLACECSFNKEEKCFAGAIDIEGSEASESEETECGTFRNQDR